MNPSILHPEPQLKGNPRGFSLIELMVVVVIMSLLVAIALPVLGSIEAQSRAVHEMSGAKVAVAGWNNYAIDRDGEVLRGYYPDSEPSEEPLYDFNGTVIASGEPQQRWFWRLAPYIDDPKSVFYPDSLDVVRRELIDVPEHQYSATIHPAFGLNGEWIGGLGETLANELYALYEYGDLGSCPWERRLSEIKNPSNLIIFGSSRFGSTDNSGGGSGSIPGIVEGFHRIQSPCHPTNGIRWKTTDNGTVLSAMTDDPADHGFISARHSGKAVTAMADGSTRLESLTDIGDMRRWADDAWKRDWVLVP